MSNKRDIVGGQALPVVLHDGAGNAPGSSGLLSAPIDVAAQGDNTIVAAQAGRTIVVYAYAFVASSAVAVRWKDGLGNALSGAMSHAANGGMIPAITPPGFCFKAAQGAALVLNLGSAVQVSGHVSYWLEP